MSSCGIFLHYFHKITKNDIYIRVYLFIKLIKNNIGLRVHSIIWNNPICFWAWFFADYLNRMGGVPQGTVTTVVKLTPLSMSYSHESDGGI